jgi:hypothetical protein
MSKRIVSGAMGKTLRLMALPTLIKQLQKEHY